MGCHTLHRTLTYTAWTNCKRMIEKAIGVFYRCVCSDTLSSLTETFILNIDFSACRAHEGTPKAIRRWRCHSNCNLSWNKKWRYTPVSFIGQIKANSLYHSRLEGLGATDVQSEDDQGTDSEHDPPNWQQLVGRDVLAGLRPQEIKRQEVINGEDIVNLFRYYHLSIQICFQRFGTLLCIGKQITIWYTSFFST